MFQSDTDVFPNSMKPVETMIEFTKILSSDLLYARVIGFDPNLLD